MTEQDKIKRANEKWLNRKTSSDRTKAQEKWIAQYKRLYCGNDNVRKMLMKRDNDVIQ